MVEMEVLREAEATAGALVVAEGVVATAVVTDVEEEALEAVVD